jgi:hypothetical protein
MEIAKNGFWFDVKRVCLRFRTKVHLDVWHVIPVYECYAYNTE